MSDAQHDPHELNSLDDLVALAQRMPVQDQFRFLSAINRMQHKKISVEQAMGEIKDLFFKNGIYEDGEKEMTGKPMAIKFRGICILQGEFYGKWVYGDLLQKQGKTYICPHTNSVRINGHIGKLLIMHEVDPRTVGQYTGMKDRNSKEIYDGDIFEAPHDFGPGGFEKRRGVVKFHGLLEYRWNYWITDQLEVIGNIHENPELLNQ